MDYVANFDLTKNDIDMECQLEQPVQFDAILEINPSGIPDIRGSELIDVEKYGSTFTIKSANYTHEQGIASDTWIIKHNLDKKPSIMIVDSADNVVEGAEKYIDNNTIEIRFNGAFKGKAYLN